MIYVFCLFCELLCYIPAQIMINALACLPSAFASLIIHCPLSSHPSGTGWPESRGRAGVPQQHRPICPRLQAVVSNPQLSRNQWTCGRKGRDTTQTGTSVRLHLCRCGPLSVKQAVFFFISQSLPHPTSHTPGGRQGSSVVFALVITIWTANVQHEHCQLQTFFSFVSVRPLYNC